MWKKNSRVACVLLLAMLLLSALCAPALAIDPIVAPEEGFSVSVHFTAPGDLQATGIVTNFHLVATGDEFANFTLTDTFAEPFGGNKQALLGLKQEEWPGVLDTLVNFVESKGIKPFGSHVDTGKGAKLSGLKTPALFLLTFDGLLDKEQEYYFEMDPQLVALPGHQDKNDPDKWTNVVIQKKVEPEKWNPISITVEKVWDDDGWESSRPKSISVRLMQDGKEYDRITLPQTVGSTKKWSHTWTKLDPPISKYKVEELNVPSAYDVDIEREGNTFIITNARGSKSDSTLPQTGLNWWPVAALAVSGMVLVFLGWLARRADEESEEA